MDYSNRIKKLKNEMLQLQNLFKQIDYSSLIIIDKNSIDSDLSSNYNCSFSSCYSDLNSDHSSGVNYNNNNKRSDSTNSSGGSCSSRGFKRLREINESINFKNTNNYKNFDNSNSDENYSPTTINTILSSTPFYSCTSNNMVPTNNIDLNNNNNNNFEKNNSRDNFYYDTIINYSDDFQINSMTTPKSYCIGIEVNNNNNYNNNNNNNYNNNNNLKDGDDSLFCGTTDSEKSLTESGTVICNWDF